MARGSSGGFSGAGSGRAGGPGGGRAPGGVAVASRGVSANRGFTGGRVEAGLSGGKKGEGFNAAQARASFIRGINQGVSKVDLVAGNKTMIAGKSVEPGRRNFGSIQRPTHTVIEGNFPQRRTAAPERPILKGPTNINASQSIGLRGSEITQTPAMKPVNSKPGNTEAKIQNIRDQFRLAFTGPQKAGDLTTPRAELRAASPQRFDTRTNVFQGRAEGTPKLAIRSEHNPRSLPVEKIKTDLRKIGVQRTATKSGSVNSGSMSEFLELQKRAEEQKKEAAKKASEKFEIKPSPGPADKAISLLKKRNRAKLIGPINTAPQRNVNPFEALIKNITKKRKEAESAKLKVKQLRITDPINPGKPKTDVRVQFAAQTKTSGDRVVSTVPESRASAATNVSEQMQRAYQRYGQPNRPKNLIDIRNQLMPDKPIPPATTPSMEPEVKRIQFSVDIRARNNRLRETRAGVMEVLRKSKDRLVSGAQIFPYLTDSAATASEIAAPKFDVSNRDRIIQTAQLISMSEVEFNTRVEELNKLESNTPVRKGDGEWVSQSQVRRVAVNDKRDKFTKAA